MAENKLHTKKEVRIDYLYLDRDTCDRCRDTETALDEVVEVLRPALELAGYTVTCRKREMATAQLAEQYHFLSSPTILVNGQDPFGAIQEASCGCCSQIAGTEISCRVFSCGGETQESPTKAMLANAILNNLEPQPACSCGIYQLPENLKRFYEGKEKQETHACDCACHRGQ